MFSIFLKNNWNFDRDYIGSVDGFGQYGHLNNLNSSDSCTRVSFHFSTFSALQFLMYRCFTSFVKFIPKDLTVFDAIVNGIIFFILQIVNWCTDFCMLILCFVALLTSFIRANSFFSWSTEDFLCKIMSSSKKHFYFFCSHLNAF